MTVNEKSCGAVVYRRGEQVEYLLLHYGAGHWDYVKGQVEPNEAERDTVMRELKEETGIVNGRFVEGFRESIHYVYRRHGVTIFKEVVFYLVETLEREVRLSYEHIGYAWLGYEKALQQLTFANAKKVLEKVHEYLVALGIEK